MYIFACGFMTKTKDKQISRLIHISRCVFLNALKHDHKLISTCIHLSSPSPSFNHHHQHTQVIRPSAAVEQLVTSRFGANEHALGVHVRVTMTKEAGAGGDTQIGPSSTIPLRRQGQVRGIYIIEYVILRS